jgi:hypothetical protein
MFHGFISKIMIKKIKIEKKIRPARTTNGGGALPPTRAPRCPKRRRGRRGNVCDLRRFRHTRPFGGFWFSGAGRHEIASVTRRSSQDHASRRDSCRPDCHRALRTRFWWWVLVQEGRMEIRKSSMNPRLLVSPIHFLYLYYYL